MTNTGKFEEQIKHLVPNNATQKTTSKLNGLKQNLLIMYLQLTVWLGSSLNVDLK